MDGKKPWRDHATDEMEGRCERREKREEEEGGGDEHDSIILLTQPLAG